MSTPNDWPAFPVPLPGEASSGLTAQEHAAIMLRVPMSGTDWLDAMITEARRLDLREKLAAAMVVADWDDPENIPADAGFLAVKVCQEPMDADPDTPVAP